MRRYGLVLLLLLVSESSSTHAQQQDPEGWMRGPGVGRLGAVATVPVPEDYTFLDAVATRRFLEENQNIPGGNELGTLLRVMPNKDYWFAVFSYAETGHVDDTDRDAIDAPALMKSMKAGSRERNEERRRRGWPELDLVGWHQAPYYDPASSNLTWSTRLQSGGSTTINHSVRLLGRTGTMSVQLVADPAGIADATVEFNGVLRSYSYNSGQRYAEFRQGDKLAGYGLAALITGGAGAAAVKTGLLQKFWKLIVLGCVALLGVARRLFGSLFGRKDGEPQPALPAEPTRDGAAQ
jgi:uncharacterized membrane-anchored protein